MTDHILLSPSQYGTAEACLRKWGFAYIDEVKSPGSPATSFGLELHHVGEQYLRKEASPDPKTKAGKLLIAGLHFLPIPHDGLLVEDGFVFDDAPLKWRGFIDLLDPTVKPIRYTDHKTTSNLRYAKTPEQLKTDTQAIIYGKHVMDRYGVDEVEAQWIYYQKSSAPKVQETKIRLTREEIEGEYRKRRKLGLKLYELKNNLTTGCSIPVEEFPHSGCSQYGGCYYFQICKDLEESKERIPMSDLLAKLKKMKEASEEPKPAINPPKEENYLDKVHIPKEEPVEVAEVAEESTSEPPAPKRRGRPKGSKNSKSKAQTKEAPPVKEEGPTWATPSGTGSYTLYVDCLPIHYAPVTPGVVSANTLLTKAAEAVVEEYNIHHYRMMEYGSGPAVFSYEVEKLILSEGFGSDRVYVDSNSQMVKDCISMLESHAVETVRKV